MSYSDLKNEPDGIAISKSSNDVFIISYRNITKYVRSDYDVKATFVFSVQTKGELTNLCLDSQGNVIVTGRTIEGQYKYIYTAKYSSTGVLIWEYTGIDRSRGR